MEKVKKIFNQKTRNILSIIIIILGVAFLINYIFYTPSYINAYIATNIYKEPANKYFDDDNFYKCVVDAYNRENKPSIPYTQNLSDSQLGSIKKVDCDGKKASDNAKVKSAKGIEKLTALTWLDVDYNQLTILDVSNNTALTRLYAENNQLTTIDVSGATSLHELYANNNKLTTLDVSKNTKLYELYARGNQLTTLDVSKNTALTELWVYRNQLTTLDVSNNTALTRLWANANKLTTLDVSNNTALTDLDVHSNQLTTLDVRNNTALTDLDVDNNKLTTLDVSNNTALIDLNVGRNQLTTLDVSNNTALTWLDAHSNKLTTLDVSNNTKLTRLDVWNDILGGGRNQLTTLDVSKNTALTELSAGCNKLTTLDVSKNTALTELLVYRNQLTTLDVSNNTALTELHAGENRLTTLDVSKNTALTELWVYRNQLTTLDVSNNTALTKLHAGENRLTTLDVSKNTALTRLYAYDNKLTTLDVSKNIALTYLLVYNNQLTTLDVSNNTKLLFLSAQNNKLNKLSINSDIEALELDYDLVPNVELSNNSKLKNVRLWKRKYVYLEDNFVFDDIPKEYINKFNLDFSNLSWEYHESISSQDNKNFKASKLGNYVIRGIYNPGEKYTTGNGVISQKERLTYDIYVVKITSNKYNIDEKNKNISNIEGVSDKDILNDINIEYGNINEKYKILTKEIKDNKLVIKHNNEVIKEYNLVKLEVSSNEYFVEDKEIKYVGEFDVNKINLNYGNKEVKDNKLVIKHDDKVIKEYNLVKLEVSSNEYFVEDKEIRYAGEFDVNKINLNYGSKEVKNNKLIIKNNDKIIKEYNLVKLEIKSKRYSINGDNIVYVNDFDINEINLNYGSKEVKDNKLVIKYNDKVIKEYKLYGINTTYSIFYNTIYVGEDLNGENNILDRITSSDLKLSIDKDKLICKYNDEIINEFVLSSKNEYDIIDDYTKKNDIISRIPIDTDMNVFKTKINTNIGYIFKDSKNNDIATNRKLRTGDKVIFNYSSGDIDYVLSVIGDVNGDGIIDGKDIMEISNDIVGNKKLDNLSSLSGDIDNNGKMDIRDIIKMGNYIKKGKF